MRTSQSFQDLEGPTTPRKANLYSLNFFTDIYVEGAEKGWKSSNPLPSPPPHTTVYRRGFSVALGSINNVMYLL
jgi:hypothetical protein